MQRRDLMRSFLVAFASLSFVAGCGGSVSEGNLPPEKPATQADSDKAVEEALKATGRMKTDRKK
jgi:hypothetical protein